MLQSIHDKTKGILGIVIIGFLVIAFGLWGIGDHLNGATEKFAAKVDDVEISLSQFEQGLARQRQRMEQMFQGKVPEGLAFEQRMKHQVLEQLITRQVMQKMVIDEGYRVADVVLAERIKGMKAFNQNGAFDKKSYQSAVASQGMTVREFESLFRNDLAVQQMQEAVTRSAFIGKAELNILNKLKEQTRDINYLQFEDSYFLPKISVTEDEIKAYFDANRSRYMHPEAITVSYVELIGQQLAKDVAVDEEAVRKLYDSYATNISLKEQRKAQHILLTVALDEDDATKKEKQEKIELLLQRINKGESFEAIAKEFSQDTGSAPKGGDLGWVGKGMMLPEFDDALFKLQKDQVSKVVKSSFGYHIIRFTDVRSEKVVSFEDKKPELVKRYKEQLVENSFYEKSELMATLAYENDQSLQEVADELGLEIKTSKSFTRQQGQGIAANNNVRIAAFKANVVSDNRNSDIIELEKNHVVVLRMESHTEAKPKSIDDVKQFIEVTLKGEKSKEKTMAAALEALAKLEGGTSIEDEHLQALAKLNKLGPVKRDNMTVEQTLLNHAFSMSKPVDNKPVYKVVETHDGAAVIELKSVTVPDVATQEQLDVLSKQSVSDQANRDMGVVLGYLKTKSKIVRSENL
ncbi:hypothetical protein MNBD_GAMMA07-2199 [hydrothermal vent metagenome]|uniref:Periplasmic chaperone PpiD n=1 Tax=hydrothermal vent metagenome TaxID=652676 RepID=A0A3B0WKU9_9ZZZZ